MKCANKSVFKELHGSEKLRYLADYYKFPFLVACIIIYIIGYTIYGHFSKKETAIYDACVNVTFGNNLENKLGDEFIDYLGINSKKNTCTFYKNLYLTADTSSVYYEYTYASRMKILAAIDAKQLDIVIMDKEAYDAFSEQGYLCDLNELLSNNDTLYENLCNNLIKNDDIMNGIDVTNLTFFNEAGFDNTVYMGVIDNSPRKDMVIKYLRYLFE